MDGSQFDRLAKSLSSIGTRRGILHLIGALPLGVTLASLLGETPDTATAEDDDHGSSHRRHRRVARHRHRPGQHKDNPTHKRKGKRKGCNPESRAKTCAGTCTTVQNNCGKHVDCGPCPVCQTCNPATGLCEPATDGTACGPGGSDAVCCQGGVCPSPSGCLPGGSPCGPTSQDCLDDCCSQIPEGNPGSFTCGKSVGNPCESDQDCQTDAGSACHCGTCCVAAGFVGLCTTFDPRPDACCSRACNGFACA